MQLQVRHDMMACTAMLHAAFTTQSNATMIAALCTSVSGRLLGFSLGNMQDCAAELHKSVGAPAGDS
jgi:hypothetical protein